MCQITGYLRGYTRMAITPPCLRPSLAFSIALNQTPSPRLHLHPTRPRRLGPGPLGCPPPPPRRRPPGSRHSQPPPPQPALSTTLSPTTTPPQRLPHRVRFLQPLLRPSPTALSPPSPRRPAPRPPCPLRARRSRRTRVRPFICGRFRPHLRPTTPPPPLPPRALPVCPAWAAAPAGVVAVAARVWFL